MYLQSPYIIWHADVVFVNLSLISVKVKKVFLFNIFNSGNLFITKFL